MGKYYSFEEFQATGVDSADVSHLSGSEVAEAGRLYLNGNLWIQSAGNGQWWTLGHGHDERLGALADCERFLYAFAISNGNFSTLATTDDLADELAAYCKAEGLPEQCAMELLCEDITPEQRQWLSDFVRIWESVEAREDYQRNLINRGESI